MDGTPGVHQVLRLPRKPQRRSGGDPQAPASTRQHPTTWRARETGGGEGGRSGSNTKNKNPTRQCGEQHIVRLSSTLGTLALNLIADSRKWQRKLLVTSLDIWFHSSSLKALPCLLAHLYRFTVAVKKSKHTSRLLWTSPAYCRPSAAVALFYTHLRRIHNIDNTKQ